ncbi:MAG: hypothetical protein RL662_978 [Bacteroidota bacterium]|jgi:hypothetical protein
MKESLNILSFFILGIAILLLVVGIIMLISVVFVDDKKKRAINALKVILLGTLLGIGGFTLCTMTFSLGPMH